VITVQIIGTGKVARQLAIRFRESVLITLKAIAGRDQHACGNIRDLVSDTVICTDLDSLLSTDIIILAVTDTAIATVSDKIDARGALVLHTSGSVPMAALKNHKRYGVLYPLQSFSESNRVDWDTVPVCIEAHTVSDLDIVRTIASVLSPKIFEVTTAQRKHLHVAAVFANNFANHCFTMAQEICEKHTIPFELLHPLILETATKAITQEPDKSQTGPAMRGDKEIILAHLETLDTEPKEIYRVLTNAITHYYGRKKL